MNDPVALVNNARVSVSGRYLLTLNRGGAGTTLQLLSGARVVFDVQSNTDAVQVELCLNGAYTVAIAGTGTAWIQHV